MHRLALTVFHQVLFACSHNGADFKRTTWASIWTLPSVNQKPVLLWMGEDHRIQTTQQWYWGCTWKALWLASVGSEPIFSCM